MRAVREADGLMDYFILVIVAVVVVIGIMLAAINPLVDMPFGPMHDLREDYKPTGREARVTILDNDDGCLFEVDGKRHITNTGLFIEDSCPYLQGEEVIAYEVKGGWWETKGLASEIGEGE